MAETLQLSWKSRRTLDYFERIVIAARLHLNALQYPEAVALVLIRAHQPHCRFSFKLPLRTVPTSVKAWSVIPRETSTGFHGVIGRRNFQDYRTSGRVERGGDIRLLPVPGGLREDCRRGFKFPSRRCHIADTNVQFPQDSWRDL